MLRQKKKKFHLFIKSMHRERVCVLERREEERRENRKIESEKKIEYAF